MNQQTADVAKAAFNGLLGVAVSIGNLTEGKLDLTDANTIAGLGVALMTMIYLGSMVWLNAKRGKRIDRTTIDDKGNTRAPIPVSPKPPTNL